MDRNIVLLLCLCLAVFQARGISLTRQGGNIVLITFALITNSVAPTHICFAASSQSSGNYCISMIWLKQLVSKVLFNLDVNFDRRLIVPTHICFAASSQSAGNYCISEIWLKQLVSKVLFNLDLDRRLIIFVLSTHKFGFSDPFGSIKSAPLSRACGNPRLGPGLLLSLARLSLVLRRIESERKWYTT